MKWQEYYQSRTTTAEQAVKAIKSGDRVVLGHACGEPQLIVDALVARADELENVEIAHEVPMGKGIYCLPEYEKSFRHNALFAGKPSRQAIKEGRADYTAIYLHELPPLFQSGVFPIDVAMVTTSPPDENGFVSLGVAVDYTLQAIKSARIVIAEVNSNMPRTGKGSLVNVMDLDHFVATDLPLIEQTPPVIGPVEQTIGRNIAELIKDGDCLQLGIGAVPDAILSCLQGKKDLGIHSEMISDGVMNLVKSGVINCSRKNYYPGKIVIAFAMGTSGFYKWLDNNPMIEGLPVSITNEPYNICKNDNMVAINSALSVDLLGQVAADTLPGIQFSGVGGQVDFVRGANNSKGGRAIIALPATAAKGRVSRIVSTLAPGQAVTTSRYDVDYVVTEYGAAHLKWKTNRDRAKLLINIAAPEFRETLRAEYNQLYGGLD
ncbi:MAG TPA: acetyl-CoA hydrolase/transferase C-terminal domain-containing protein [Syntrophomonadaceae bacterium]|nr:acetyl-CoA hydrolase/transferase C-terminal domain-containing protein [Syntrophomonadaceae bacterium]HPR92865.1 acetyl-CoA hydrolase/transferase C-terminal domain-containing protein [Syntrophomonadaceae bacterium]